MDRAHRRHLGRHQLFLEDLPEIIPVYHAQRNGLGRIDDAAAAHCQEEVRTLCLCLFQALFHQRQAGIGLYAAKLNKGNARIVELCHHDIIQAGTLYAPAAVHQHNLGATVLFYLFGNLLFSPFAKDNVGIHVVLEIFHQKTPLLMIYC